MSIFEDQKDFMMTGGQSVDELDCEQVELYEKLIKEEYDELTIALGDWVDTLTEQKAEVIKETIDVIVVSIGLLFSMGIDPQKAWNIVHENNLAKVQDSKNIKYDENGKIMKSPESIERKKQMMIDIRELLND